MGSAWMGILSAEITRCVPRRAASTARSAVKSCSRSESRFWIQDLRCSKDLPVSGSTPQSRARRTQRAVQWYQAGSSGSICLERGPGDRVSRDRSRVYEKESFLLGGKAPSPPLTA